jgi:hypothetical protein
MQTVRATSSVMVMRFGESRRLLSRSDRLPGVPGSTSLQGPVWVPHHLSSQGSYTQVLSTMGKLPLYTTRPCDETGTPATSRRKRLTAVALIGLLFFYVMTFGCAPPPPPDVSLERRVERILQATPLIGRCPPSLPPSGWSYLDAVADDQTRTSISRSSCA